MRSGRHSLPLRRILGKYALALRRKENVTYQRRTGAAMTPGAGAFLFRPHQSIRLTRLSEFIP